MSNSTTHLPLVIEPAELEAVLDSEQLLIVDLSNGQNYLNGHVPGAVYVSPQEIVCGTAPTPGRLPTETQLTQLFSRLGLKPETHVVVYDDEGGGWAGRFIWTLDVIGHKHYSYLNGGLLAWRSEGRVQQTKNTTPKACDVSITIDRSAIAEIDDILAEFDNSNAVVWDARSPAEYCGEKILAQKGGHIPGAINCEWTNLMDRQRDLRIRDDAEKYLATLGLTRDKKIVTHCQSHHRSGFTYLVGKTLGFDIRAYHGSWSEWGNHPDTPVET